MRLFIAIPFPLPIKQQLSDLMHPVAGVNWQKKSQLHLTLKFLGETDRRSALELKRELATIDISVFSISLKGLGYFPRGKQPKVIWAGIAGSQTLFSLKESIEEVCTSKGFEADDRSFKPHITLGRVQNTSKRDVLSFINQNKQFQIPDVSVEEFVLYESKLKSGGAVHHRLKTFSLNGNDSR